MATDSEIIRFRGVQGRTLEDQAAAISAGYSSMYEYAIDELAKMVHELTARVDELERNAR